MDFEIKKVAQLARLSLKPEEEARLEKDLAAILDYVKNLAALDTEGIEPTSHVLGLENVFRPDEVTATDVSEKVLAHAPAKDGRFFKVPKVVDKT